MKPENITLAIQEVLNEIDRVSKPANEILSAYTRARRYIGSKDRRAIQEGVWGELRHRPWPKWLEKVFPETEKEAILNYYCQGHGLTECKKTFNHSLKTIKNILNVDSSWKNIGFINDSTSSFDLSFSSTFK